MSSLTTQALLLHIRLMLMHHRPYKGPVGAFLRWLGK
jgi:hypothetical protein